MDHLFYLLIQYKYFILFPIAIVEGPALAVIAGFLCLHGYLNPFLVLGLIVLGDITGDTICYSFGRWGLPDFLRKIAYWIGIDSARVSRTKRYLYGHPKMIIPISKITLGVGVTGIYLAGIAKIPYRVFISICLVTSICQYIIYLAIGGLFGYAYVQICHYLNIAGSIAIIVALTILIFFIVKSIFKKI